MNNTIEVIKQGKHVEITELFELVNQYKITMLSVGTFSMDVNRFEECNSNYEFIQVNTTNNYTVNSGEITGVEAKYIPADDGVSISCALKNGGNLNLYILKVSQYEVETDNYKEIDLEELKDYLDSFRANGGTYIKVRLNDLHGLHLKLPMVDFADIEEDENEDYTLYIGGGSGELKVSLYDDSCNAFYKKKTSAADEFIIRPYGQPFTEITLLCFKNK